ncbi:MAG: SMC family ATPase [Thermoplasmatales archaeon]|nr:SMC family ATPase [Thermoplasmatales archaeon]
MKLISLRLHNFRKFRDVEINFPTGLIGLVGNNGVGKSTIIEAIGWAIYGSRALRNRDQKQIKTQWAPAGEDCWVNLKFEMGGNVYEVTRIMSGSATDARVKVNGSIMASSSAGVTEFLERKIGMDCESFYTSIFAKQQELNALSNKSSSERKKNMLKMLRIDLLDDAIKKVREDRRNKQEILEWMEKNLRSLDDLRKNLEANKNRLNFLVSKKMEVENELKKLSEEIKFLEEERRKEKEKAEKFKELNNSKKILEERIKSKFEIKEAKLKEIEEILKKKKEHEEIKKFAEEYERIYIIKESMDSILEKYIEKKKIEDELFRKNREIEDFEKEIKKLAKQLEGEEKIFEEIEEIEKIINEINKKREKLSIERNEKNAEIKEKEKRKKNLEKNLKELKEAGEDSNCPTCGRPLKEKYKEILANIENEINEYEGRIRELALQVLKIEEDYKKLEMENKENELKKKKMEETSRKISSLREKIKFFDEQKNSRIEERNRLLLKIKEYEGILFDEEEYNKISKRLKELLPIKNKSSILENEIKKIPQIEKEIEEIEKDISLISSQIKNLTVEIEKLSFDEKKYAKIEEDYEIVRNKMKEAEKEFIRLEGEIENVKKEIDRNEKDIKEEEEKREKIKVLRKEIAGLEMLAGDRETGLLNDFKRYLISKIGPTLSLFASQFFSKFTQGKYKEIEIDEDYNIGIYDGGEKFDIERFSGGEKDIANLSLRLAISQLISQRSDVSLNLIALDEIFGSQDRERRKSILNALAELRDQFSQIILITHIDDIKESLENIIKIYENEDGSSRIEIE